LKAIQHYCDAIAAAFKPQCIILFGSHAYGSPTADSDVVLLVMPKARRFRMQTTRYRITKAEHDHLTAVDLARRRKPPLQDMVRFHIQQAAGKYLNACLGEGSGPSACSSATRGTTRARFTQKVRWQTARPSATKAANSLD
jgi:predicted nucleotidyltransferase